MDGWAIVPLRPGAPGLTNYIDQPDGYPGAWPRKPMRRKRKTSKSVEQKALDVLLQEMKGLEPFRGSAGRLSNHLNVH